MAADLYFVAGLGLVVLTLPLVLGALLDDSVPLITGPVLLIGIGLLAYGVVLYDGAFSVRDIPDAIIRAIGIWVN